MLKHLPSFCIVTLWAIRTRLKSRCPFWPSQYHYKHECELPDSGLASPKRSFGA
jgi:hypothetical protein